MSSPSQTPSATPSPAAKLIKAELQVAAALLTSAVIGKMNVQVPADQTIKDQGLQSLNLTAAQLQKIFYSFLDKAEDNAGVDPDGTINGWQDPVMPTGPNAADVNAIAQNLPATVLQAIGGTGALAGLPAAAIQALKAVAALIPAPQSQPVAGPAQTLTGS
jgi:hypothetical protein